MRGTTQMFSLEPQTEAIPEDNTDYMPDFIQKMVDDPPFCLGSPPTLFGVCSPRLSGIILSVPKLTGSTN